MKMENIAQFVAEYGIPKMVICHAQEVAFVTAWVDHLPAWEDVRVQASEECARGQVYMVALNG